MHQEPQDRSLKLTPSVRLNRRWVLLLLTVAAVAGMAGCTGIPSSEEISARRQLAEVSRGYSQSAEGVSINAETPLSELLELAVRRSPQVEAAYFDWMRAVETITVERSLPDPRLTFETDIQDVVMGVMPGLMIDVPGPGKLRAQAAVAAGEARVKYAEFRRAVLMSAANFKRAYFELQALEDSIQVNKRNIKLVHELKDIAQAQHAANRASLQDVLRAEIEADELEVRIENLEDSRSVAVTRYKTALGFNLAVHAEIQVPTRFENTKDAPSLEEIYQIALARNPTLVLMESEIRRAEAAVTLARRSSVPDFSLGVETDVKPSTPIVTPQFSITLPIWRDKIAAEIKAAVAARNAALARYTEEQLTLAVEFAAMAFMYRESERELQLLVDRLIPKAKDSLDVARSGYVGGQSSFIDFLEAERSLLQFELATVDARKSREEALLNLSLTIGGILPLGELDSAGSETEEQL
ncbi:MAG: TolC family protein [Bdellovibrionota bacterium]|nr:MAG: TolC family protein [Bdellovibrionota bacterium]